MNDYGFIIDNWVWSFSRINYNCLHELKLHYIDCEDSVDNGSAQFGTLMHTILEWYAKGEIEKENLVAYYEEHFNDVVTLPFPYNKYANLKEKSYYAGLEYFENIEALNLEKYEILGVEKKVTFEINGYQFIGYIDLLLKDKTSKEITILDHKSANLKILKNGKVSKTDEWQLDKFKKQLLLYAIPILEEYGRVDFLEWNLFKMNKKLKIPFSMEELEKAKMWAIEQIETVKNTEEWTKNPSFFYCRNLCCCRHICEEGSYYAGSCGNCETI